MKNWSLLFVTKVCEYSWKLSLALILFDVLAILVIPTKQVCKIMCFKSFCRFLQVQYVEKNLIVMIFGVYRWLLERTLAEICWLNWEKSNFVTFSFWHSCKQYFQWYCSNLKCKYESNFSKRTKNHLYCQYLPNAQHEVIYSLGYYY